MKELVEVATHTFNFFGFAVTINIATIIVTWIIIMLMIAFGVLSMRSLKRVPGKAQVIMEMLVNWFDGVLKESMGEDGRKFLPFIVTLFLFILLGNWCNLIPRVPAPTADINTCFALGIVVLFVAHISAIRKKGLLKYLKGYIEPVWFLLPSNIFSEVSKVLSHSLRLFGNIFAGGIVIAIVPFILWRIFGWIGIVPNILAMPVLNAIFGIFFGSIQAFVFAILAVAYISVLREA